MSKAVLRNVAVGTIGLLSNPAVFAAAGGLTLLTVTAAVNGAGLWLYERATPDMGPAFPRPG